MMNPFPYLLSYWLFVPTFLRIVVGLYFLSFGYNGLFKEFEEKRSFLRSLRVKPATFFVYTIAIVEIVASIGLITGAQTQISAMILVLIGITGGFIKSKWKHAPLKETDTYTLLVAILLSLIITGAGYLAVDYPF